MNDIALSLLNWYRKNQRSLPWRSAPTPYNVWLSEIILQQTRVEQGLPYYQRFTEHFPTVTDLASAEEEEVLKLWQGLGYYSRARNLHAAAKQVLSDFDGSFPANAESLQQLKGVGPYTAAAIASIAFDEAVPVVDGNVLRVISRLTGSTLAINSTAGIARVRETMNKLITNEKPGDFNQAVMELGALVCKPQNPDCINCPISNHCQAFRDQSTDRIPFKEKKTKVKALFLYYLIAVQDSKVVVRKRPDKGIWAKMYDFPCVESDKELANAEVIHRFEKNGISIETIQTISPPVKHLLSHRKITATFFRASEVSIHEKLNLERVTEEVFNTLPLPKLIENATTKLWQ